MSDDIEVVYLGPCTISGGKAGALFVTPDLLGSRADWTLDKLFNAASPFAAVSGCSVGTVYRSTGTVEDQNVRTLGLKRLIYARRAVHPIIAQFELRAAALEAEKRAEAAERKAKANPRIMAEVQALGGMLRKTPYTQQAAFEAAIIQLIRNAARGTR